MDIFRTNISNIDLDPQIQQRKITKTSGYGTKISSSHRSGDHLTLSESAIEFKELKGMLEKIPDVRQEKVLELKEKIQHDEYNIDSEKVAEEILMEETTLARFL